MLPAPTNLVFQLLDDVDPTSCLPPFSLDTVDIDGESIYYLGSGDIIPSAKYFSEIKCLEIRDIYVDFLFSVYGWVIMLPASQSLTTLSLLGGNICICKFPIDLACGCIY
jgi:hypothetical protein